MRHVPIPGEDEPQWNEHPHREWIFSPLMGMCLTGNGDVSYWECTSSPGIGICLTRNAYPHRDWECASSRMHISPEMERASPGINILTRNGYVPHQEYTSHREWDVPHRECISSLGIGMCLTGNAHRHRECISSPGMGMCITVNAHRHRECISSPGMHIDDTG